MTDDVDYGGRWWNTRWRGGSLAVFSDKIQIDLSRKRRMWRGDYCGRRIRRYTRCRPAPLRRGERNDKLACGIGGSVTRTRAHAELRTALHAELWIRPNVFTRVIIRLPPCTQHVLSSSTSAFLFYSSSCSRTRPSRARKLKWVRRRGHLFHSLISSLIKRDSL